MINFTNIQSAFFTVETFADPSFLKKLDVDKQVLKDDIISLSVVEEVGKLPSGTLKLHDPHNVYSLIMKDGMLLKIDWGYKSNDKSDNSAVALKRNPGDFFGPPIRRGFRAIIQNPQGEGDNKGVKTFTCRFLGIQYSKMATEKVNKLFQVGTKGSVITQVFLDSGVSSPTVVFSQMSDVVGVNAPEIRQSSETNFQFLNRLARKWGCVFKVGFTPTGARTGIFVDANSSKLDLANKSTLLEGFSGAKHLFEYGAGVANVADYKWKKNEGENGGGDRVRMYMVNGKIQRHSTGAPTEKVVTYQLNMDAIQAAVKERKAQGPQAIAKLTKEVSNFTTFDQVSRFWTAVEEPTAPQGRGYTIEMNLGTGDPSVLPMHKAEVRKGFPPRLNQKGGSVMHVRKTTNTIDSKSYATQVELTDYIPFGEGLRTLT